MILRSNKINSTHFLKINQNDLNNLEYLDLEGNKILLIEDTHFLSYLNLSFLNLNSNPIESIHVSAFKGLKLLKTLRLSKSKIDSVTGSYLDQMKK
jgi:Leucine-rich repeat (LRR) protein